MLFKIILMFTLLYLTDVKGTENNYTELGYEFHPEIQGWLKLHTDLADWETARMICHDEDAVLAAPSGSIYSNTLFEILSKQSEWASPVYVGIRTDYPEGVYKYEKGTTVLSHDPADVASLNQCLALTNRGFQLWVECRINYSYICYAPMTLIQESPCGEENVGYELDERTGNCYKFHWQSQPWNDAHRTCLAEGAHLAIINSDTEAEVLVDLFAQYPFEKLNGTNSQWGVLAVGFYYWRKTDSYVTIHGQTLEEAGYAKWSYGNPSSRGKSLFGGGMFRSGLLDDVNKSYAVPFICEMKPISMRYDEKNEQKKYVLPNSF